MFWPSRSKIISSELTDRSEFSERCHSRRNTNQRNMDNGLWWGFWNSYWFPSGLFLFFSAAFRETDAFSFSSFSHFSHMNPSQQSLLRRGKWSSTIRIVIEQWFDVPREQYPPECLTSYPGRLVSFASEHPSRLLPSVARGRCSLDSTPIRSCCCRQTAATQAEAAAGNRKFTRAPDVRPHFFLNLNFVSSACWPGFNPIWVLSSWSTLSPQICGMQTCRPSSSV